MHSRNKFYYLYVYIFTVVLQVLTGYLFIISTISFELWSDTFWSPCIEWQNYFFPDLYTGWSISIGVLHVNRNSLSLTEWNIGMIAIVPRIDLREYLRWSWWWCKVPTPMQTWRGRKLPAQKLGVSSVIFRSILGSFAFLLVREGEVFGYIFNKFLLTRFGGF